ncbi:MAG: HigA family addiction module antitoxin [Treponema sp.]|nr:HigA family addiction module antitoxin [Treponema sp.]
MKNTQTPGSVIKGLLAEHGLNCNRLAKAIGMSNAMVRLLILDRSPVSIAAAFRLAKFFKTEPAYWLDLQTKFDLAKAIADKELAKELSTIVDVSKYSFVRKPHSAKESKAAPAPKKKEAAAGKKKEAPAAKRKAPEKAPPAKAARGKPRAK